MRRRLMNTDVDGWDATAVVATLSQSTFDIDAHALQVSATTQYLQQHLYRLRIGQATHDECRAVQSIIRAAKRTAL